MASLFQALFFDYSSQITETMKTVVMTVLMFVLVPSILAQDNSHKITVLSQRMDVLYLKVSDSYVGASLTVLDSSGTKVMETTVLGKKVLLDFIDQVSGDYTIRIAQGEIIEEVKYHKM